MNDFQYLFCEDDIPIVVPKRMMIFAGHPDDEIVSCGGTILKYQELGSEIIVVIATSGLGGYAKLNQKEGILEQRQHELNLVKTFIKGKMIELNYPDLEVKREIASLVI
jgi:LmbE family N-acetylglucosaminyl deacetylase